MKARYVRISTANQNHERQLINTHSDESLFIDVCSGSIPFSKRDKGKELLNSILIGNVDYISVHAVDRLGRNLMDILTTLQILDDSGVTVKIDSLGLESRVGDKSNPAFKLITTVMGQIGEMERDTMRERQKEGIAIAKAKGRYKGRERGSLQSIEDFLNQYPKVLKELSAGMSLRKTAKLCDVSVGTVQKVKKYIENKKKV
jgi:DNA invertase Pin-like site-specific DNA recombinase